MMNCIRKILLGFIIFLLGFSCKNHETEKPDSGNEIANTNKSNQPALFLSSKQEPFDYLPTSTTNQIIKHSFYTLSYNEEKEQAEWVAYELKGTNDRKSNFKRPFFIKDPNVTSGSADWKNYKNSGYDKGHLCPAGDMTFDKNAYNETFYTSNISPQLHDFNDGVWNRLENKTRYWAEKYKRLYVITGGILKSNLQTIGKENVAVPNYFYKIIASNSDGDFKIIAFLVPNAKSDMPLYHFVVSVDSIEKLTGIDFFPKLEDKIENNLEKKSDYKEWSFN